MTKAKHETFPQKDEANWLLFSMHKIEGIKGYLQKFESDFKKKGCSATLLWSGNNGSNVPVETFGDEYIGFVLDSHHIEVPQADVVAYRSGGKVSKEVLKKDAKSSNEWGYSTGYASKYPNKSGYYRTAMGQTIFTTNLARHENIPGTKGSIYHSKGTAETFAKNIWRKFHKPPKNHLHPYVSNGIMRRNEAIVFQKDNVNPIIGLIITQTPTPEMAQQLLQILESNKSLKLYFYDKTANEHIVRYINNEQAQKYLKGNLNFYLAFEKASPFKGFSSTTVVLEGAQQKEKFILKDQNGNNYVTGVESDDKGGYKISGTNNKGEPRCIIIDKDGNATGYNGSKTLGTVENQMFQEREAILKHFGIQIPKIEARAQERTKHESLLQEKEELIRKAKSFLSCPGVENIVPLVENYKSGNEAHNSQQRLDKIQIEFKDQKSLEVFKNKYGLGADTKGVEQGITIKSGKPYLKIPSDKINPIFQSLKITEKYQYYVTSSERNRTHSSEVTTNNLQDNFKQRFQNQKGDYLKSTILKDFYESLKGAKTVEEVNKIVATYKQDGRYKILATGQDWATNFFNLSTSSAKAFEGIKEERIQEIKSSSIGIKFQGVFAVKKIICIFAMLQFVFQAEDGLKKERANSHGQIFSWY